jgi:hypothetical protein
VPCHLHRFKNPTASIIQHQHQQSISTMLHRPYASVSSVDIEPAKEREHEPQSVNVSYLGRLSTFQTVHRHQSATFVDILHPRQWSVKSAGHLRYPLMRRLNSKCVHKLQTQECHHVRTRDVVGSVMDIRITFLGGYPSDRPHIHGIRWITTFLNRKGVAK